MQRSTIQIQQSTSKDAANWAQRGTIAFAAGELAEARKCFVAAIKRNSQNARYRYNLALILESCRDLVGAAEQLTNALALDPAMLPAARRLQDILSRGVLPPQARLNEAGLRSAIAIDTIDRDLICAASVHYLSNTHPLRNILEHGRRENWLAASRRLILEKTHDILRNELFLATLRHGIVANSDIEKLLRALRTIAFIELSDRRLTDPAVCKFLSALMHQCRNNEFIWCVTPEEKQRHSEIEHEHVQSHKAIALPNARQALRGLYGRYQSPLASRASIRFEVVASGHQLLLDALYEHEQEETDILSRGERLPSLSELADDTSRKVANQYEASPYPRWTSVPVFPGSGYVADLKRFFMRGKLAFADRPFEVLIAGCGTGRQAVSAAIDYGSNARVTGFDISRTSLGYASMMADRFQLRNLTLYHGDLNRIEEFEPTFRARFNVVECSGVLHHMADPFGAWEKLLTCLAPGGIILIGLYSRIARRNLEVLRQEPSYPGPRAGIETLRTYRAELMARSGQWPGSELLRSRDTHSASGFRDFFLHVNEHVTDLDEIDRFLAKNKLEFRGFVDMPFDALRASRPNAVAPGALSEWAAWEESHPNAFRGMYQFWCTRA